MWEKEREREEEMSDVEVEEIDKEVSGESELGED